VAELKEIEGSLKEEVGQLKEVESSLTEEVGQLKETESKLNEDVASFTQKLGLMSSQVEDLKKTRDLLDAQVTKLDGANDRMRAQLDDLKTIEEGMKKFAAEAGEDYAQFVSQLTSQIDRNEALLADFADENTKLKENRKRQQVNMLLQMSSSFSHWDSKVGLSPDEFLQYLSLLGPEYEAKIKERIGSEEGQVFGTLDTDGSGTLNMNELRKMLEEITQEAEGE
jgi:uncharacterized phage infection (PIP) family protein YhgE